MSTTKTDSNVTATAKAEPKAKKAIPYMVFLESQIAAGKFCQKDLQKMGWEKFPAIAKSTISTVLVDSKNSKYNRFSKLVVKGENGILTFKK